MVIKMEKINVYAGIMKNEIFNSFYEQKGVNLFNHASNSTSIEDFLSIAYVLCPDIIVVEDYIFLGDLFEERGEDAIKEIRRLEKQFNHSKRDIERYVNSRSLGDFFFGKDTPSMNNDILLRQFGDVLIYYWTRRLKDLFPSRNIYIEVNQEIMGELGLSITMYEE